MNEFQHEYAAINWPENAAPQRVNTHNTQAFCSNQRL
jgi:hypothetical protein